MARQKNDGRGRLGGRQKGTPNKATQSIRSIVTDRWQRYVTSGQFDSDLQLLDPATRIVAMERLAQYIAPKLKSVDMASTIQVTQTIENKLSALCADLEDADIETEDDSAEE